MSRDIESRTKFLANRSAVTLADFEIFRRLVCLPLDEVKGKTIIELGAGITNVTKNLGDLGAKSTAVDFRYGNPNTLFSAVNTDGFSKSVLDEFTQDYIRNRRRYVNTLVGVERLPFADSSVDWVFSTKFLSTILLKKYDAFIRAYEDILRILKPYQAPLKSGVLVIHPWLEGLSITPVDPVSANRFTRRLEQDFKDGKIGFCTIPTEPYLPTKLVIVKTPDKH